MNTRPRNSRVEGEKGSSQNKLRYELYKEGFERIDTALKNGNYFEVVSISDSIINDRLTSLLQKTKDEEFDSSIQSVGNIIKTILSDIKHKRIDVGEIRDEFRNLLIKVERDWVSKRNFVVHSFVVVSLHNQDLTKDERLQIVKECAEEGAVYSRQITSMTDKVIRNLE